MCRSRTRPRSPARHHQPDALVAPPAAARQSPLPCPFRTSIPVRFGDVDHAGIVYYPQYYIYFHEAFEDFFNLSPFSCFQLLDRERIGFPTVHVETDFKQPLRYGDSGHRHYRRSFGRPQPDPALRGPSSPRWRSLRDGQITLACIDLDTFKSRDIPADLRELFTRFRS